MKTKAALALTLTGILLSGSDDSGGHGGHGSDD
jgi:hypothetical protein